MKLKRWPRQKAIIPTASMADIAFLLIIFFMVISGVEVDRTRVDLPLARTREEAEKGAAIVVMSKDSAGELTYRFSDGKESSKLVSGPQDIYLEATRITYSDAERQFIIKADGSVPYEKVDELLDNLRKGGVSKVMLLAAQKTDTPT